MRSSVILVGLCLLGGVGCGDNERIVLPPDMSALASDLATPDLATPDLATPDLTSILCNAGSVTILGNRNPTITPTSVPAGSSATVVCRYPTYQFLLDAVVVQDFTTNNSAKVSQMISCRDDGLWYAPNGAQFNTINCVGFAPCNGCALPQSASKL